MTQNNATLPEDRLEAAEPVVYGEVGDLLAVLPLSTALFQAKARHALEIATTWGEFKAVAPLAYEELLADFREDPEEWWPELFPTLAPLEEPPSDHPLDSGDLPGVDDGDWPGWPFREMVAFVPADLASRYGQVVPTVHNGDTLEIPWEHADAVIQALEQRGWATRRDDELMEAASGLLSGSEVHAAITRNEP